MAVGVESNNLEILTQEIKSSSFSAEIALICDVIVHREYQYESYIQKHQLALIYFMTVIQNQYTSVH